MAKFKKFRDRVSAADGDHHFFDRDAMAFFASQLHSVLYVPVEDAYVFITSEKTGFDSEERRFTVRKATFTLEGEDSERVRIGIPEGCLYLQYMDLDHATWAAVTEAERIRESV